MATRKQKPAGLKVETFAAHQVITQANPLRGALKQVADDDRDDPVARAEQALASLSGEFKDWMGSEVDRLAETHERMMRQGVTPKTRDAFFRAAHDVKGHATTFGYPMAAAAAESLCRLIEHAPDLSAVPPDLLAHHLDAIQAIVREHARVDRLGVADELSQRLRSMADKYLISVNQDRPEHLEAVLAPSIVPGG
jgi:chemotaxis protein histidine kinase CheA